MKTVHIRRNRLYARRSKTNPTHKTRVFERSVIEDPLFIFDSENYLRLKKHLAEIYISLDLRPRRTARHKFPNMPHFILEFRRNDGLTIKFNQRVVLPDGRQGSFFRIGGKSTIIQTF